MNVDEIAKQLEKSQPVAITEDGTIVKMEDTITTPSGPVDSNSGQSVTYLKPHTWYSWFDSNPRRLVDETAAMNARFPHFDLHRLQAGLTWVGLLKPSERNRAYKISIVYPDDFPSAAPKAYTVDPKLAAPKHQFSDGSLCLMYPGDGTWQTNTTAAQIAAMTATWLFCYEYHERHCTRACRGACKYWPGPER